LAAAVVACLTLLAAGCESVPLLAPDSSLRLQANPSFVVADGGRSVVTAVLTEPAGTFVPDGTEVFFFTTLGQIDERAKTVNGVARVYFVADSRSGHACVTAYSGGTAPTAATCGSLPGAASGEGSATIQIDVGGALPRSAIVTADPQRLVTQRHATIRATVFDASGNPVQNVPVVFTVSASTLVETLDSGGSPRYTDSNGQAFDTLRTRADLASAQRTVTVSASIPGIATTPTVAVLVN
jgi:hypothetical protein